ncbi:unnamed protein product [Choristocarpus tenellus]
MMTAGVQELISQCAKRDRVDETAYGRVWEATIACSEDILRTFRGVIIPQLGTITFVARCRGEADNQFRHHGLVFIMNPMFARSHSLVYCQPAYSLLAPTKEVTPVRVAIMAGLCRDFTLRAIGQATCSILLYCLGKMQRNCDHADRAY